MQPNFRNVDAIYGYITSTGFNDAEETQHEGGLSSTCPSNNSNLQVINIILQRKPLKLSCNFYHQLAANIKVKLFFIMHLLY